MSHCRCPLNLNFPTLHPTHAAPLLPQEKRRLKAAEGDRECTFSPTLIASKSKTPRPTSAAETKEAGNRFLRLYEQAKVAQVCVCVSVCMYACGCACM